MRWLWIGTILGNISIVVPSCFFLGTYYSQTSQDINEIKRRMSTFRNSLDKSQEGTYISVDQIPMPGETMVWLMPGEKHYWREKLESLQRSNTHHIKATTISELQSWCQAQKTISRVYLTMEDQKKFKIKISKDSTQSYSHLSELTDFTDLKNYCSRAITNREWYGDNFQPLKDVYVVPQKVTCFDFLDQPYSSASANVKVCLKTK